MSEMYMDLEVPTIYRTHIHISIKKNGGTTLAKLKNACLKFCMNFDMLIERKWLIDVYGADSSAILDFIE